MQKLPLRMQATEKFRYIGKYYCPLNHKKASPTS